MRFICKKYCVTILLFKRVGYIFNKSSYNVLGFYVNNLWIIFEHFMMWKLQDRLGYHCGVAGLIHFLQCRRTIFIHCVKRFERCVFVFIS